MLLLIWFLPLLTALLSIPLILRWVGPNPLYGFRTRFTMSNREIWFRANHIAGIYMLIASGIACVGLGIAQAMHISQDRLLESFPLLFAAILMGALGLAFVRIRRWQ